MIVVTGVRNLRFGKNRPLSDCLTNSVYQPQREAHAQFTRQFAADKRYSLDAEIWRSNAMCTAGTSAGVPYA